MFGLSSLSLSLIGAVAAVALTVGGLWYVYDLGGKAREATVKAQVQGKTIEEILKARAVKDQADQDVRAKPYDERVDGLK